MTNRELRKLSRKELLEVMVIQSREIEDLSRENEDLKKKLEEKENQYSGVGSLAETALGVSGVFEAAQQAADRYLKEIEAMKTEQENALNKARKDSEAMIAYAADLVREKMQKANDYSEYVKQQINRYFKEHPEIRDYIVNDKKRR